MPGPTKYDILIGFFFVIAGLVLALCDQWALLSKVEGLPTMKEHYFNHTFFVWTLKQILLACLLPLWKAIDSNLMGMGRFRHAEFDNADRRNNPANKIPTLENNDNQNDGDGRVEVVEPDVNNDLVNYADIQPINDGRNEPGNENEANDRQPLIGADQLQPANQPRPYRRRTKKYTKLLFFPPAFFNQAHIILIYFGMRLTYPSSMVMLKGTESFFVFLLALAFLAQQIAVFMWIGVIIVASGFAISGLSDYIHILPDGYEPYGIAAGDLLFAMGQITVATQMIYEEKFMRKLSIHPMKFLGAEGVYSMVFSIICLIIFNCIDTVQYTQLPNYRVEDILDAFAQLGNSWHLIIALLGSLISYVVFMYLGMLIIKEHGAMARVMIATLPYAFFWAISVGIKWQHFYITQVPGLVMIPCGLLIYSHILVFPCLQGNNMAGEIGPNFFMNDDDNNQHTDAMGNMPPDGDDEQEEGDEVVNQNGGHNGPYAMNGDAQLIQDGVCIPGPVGADVPLLHAV